MEENRKVALRLCGVKKRYRLGTYGGNTFREELQSRWARFRGREDPNLRIGLDPSLLGKTFWALDGIDLTVYKGERLGIIGANGAGKSTLLKLLSRVTAPTEGDLYLHGRVSSMLEVGTGFHGEMTGRENIYMNGAILGMTTAEINEKMEDIIDFSEVRQFIDTPVKRYSSGMFVKLAFSVAAHLNSEILIMDEVLAVGDMAFQKKCLDKMRRTADEDGRTILYVSHNMETIRRLCDRCIVLDKGKIIFDGDPETAIAIYMDTSVGGSDVEIDLREAAHNGLGILTMEHLSILEKSVPTFESEETLRLALRVRTDRPLENLQLRLTLRTDGDVGLGTAWSECCTLAEAGEYVLRLAFPLNLVSKGVFYASLGLYQSDELGRMLVLDHITRAFRMEVLGVPAWHVGTHGYIRFPAPSLEIERDRE